MAAIPSHDWLQGVALWSELFARLTYEDVLPMPAN